jgi:hypothetical protein
MRQGQLEDIANIETPDVTTGVFKRLNPGGSRYRLSAT